MCTGCPAGVDDISGRVDRECHYGSNTNIVHIVLQNLLGHPLTASNTCALGGSSHVVAADILLACGKHMMVVF